MNTLGDVIAEVQGLLGDPDGEWVTRDYILPFIGTTYRMQYLELKNASGRNLEQVVQLPAVDAGTNSLYPLQASGKALAGLTDPLQVWWKAAGAFDSCYSQGMPRETLPFSYSGGGPLYYVWRGNQLTLTPLNFPVDLLVYGRFNPPPLTDDAQLLVVSPDLQSPLALGTAALAGVERTNPAVLEGYAELATAGINNIAADLFRQKQAASKRLGRQAPTCGWYWNR